MQKITKFVNDKLKPRVDDDLVDRLNYYWTSAMLSIFAVGVIGKQYVGEPIQCWLPAEFKGMWEKYSESYCFAENTYFVRFNDSFPKNMDVHRDLEIHYYQWVPFVFIAQMLLFMLPKMLWRLFGKRDGLDINNLIELANSMSEAAASEIQTYQVAANKRAKLRNPKKNLNVSLEDVRATRMARNNSKFSIFYLIYKVINVINVLAQFLILNKFLGPEYTFWGFGILKDLVEGREWYHSGHFPRVTFCDISIREMGNHFVHHTFQCVLMINMINEKLFLFLWFWLAFVAAVNLINLGKWIYATISSSSAVGFLRGQLSMKFDNVEESVTDADIEKFYQDYLRRDGVTILRLIDINTDGLNSQEIVSELWDGYSTAVKKEKAAKGVDISSPMGPWTKQKDGSSTLGQFDMRNCRYNSGQVRYPLHM